MTAAFNGLIGPVVSAKLAADFESLKKMAEQMTAPSGYSSMYFETYCKWQQAFSMADDNGAVYFR